MPVERPKTWGQSRGLRLPGPNRGPGIVAVTIVVHARAPRLVRPRDVAGALDVDLGRRSHDSHVDVLVVCFMPDHVHLLLRLDGEGRTLADYVNVWKGLWTRRLAVPSESPFWQRSFYDHWMRKGEDAEYARYIADNPTRKGLVARWNDHPFTRVYVPLL
ncbi:MAG: transposase [Acidobacteria bacterium]|nr:transposase [Acidobacteriota bacterium]